MAARAAKAPGSRLAGCWSSPPGTTASGCSPAHGLLDDRVARRALRQASTTEEIELLAAPRRRRRALPPLERRCSAAGSRRSRELREAGIRVGLGTDSPASAPSFDLFEELRDRVSLARARAERPDALSRDSGAGARDARRGPRARARRRDRLARRRASGPTSRSSRLPALRIYHGRIRLPRWSSAARRSESRYSRRRREPLRERRKRMARADRRSARNARGRMLAAQQRATVTS